MYSQGLSGIGDGNDFTATRSKPPEVSSTMVVTPAPMMLDIMLSTVTVKMTSPKMNMLNPVRKRARSGYDTAVTATAR